MSLNMSSAKWWSFYVSALIVGALLRGWLMFRWANYIDGARGKTNKQANKQNNTLQTTWIGKSSSLHNLCHYRWVVLHTRNTIQWLTKAVYIVPVNQTGQWYYGESKYPCLTWQWNKIYSDSYFRNTRQCYRSNFCGTRWIISLCVT